MKKIYLFLLFLMAAFASHAQTDYGLAVAGIRVTSSNASSITGYGISGTVSYAPATHTLTLMSATIDVTDLNICAIATDYDSRHDFKIRLLGNNYIKTNSDNIAIRINESAAFTIFSPGGNGTLDCQGMLFLDARKYITNECTMSYIKDCTLRVGEIWSDDYEECLTINNAQVTADAIDVGSDHNGQKSVTLIGCYLAYPYGGYFDCTGGVSVGYDESWYGRVEVRRGTLCGDVNGDGIVSSVDVTVLYNWLLNGSTSAMVCGDQDGDGIISSVDITVVYNILLGDTPSMVFNQYTVNGVTFRMIDVVGGTFMMGGPGIDNNPMTLPIHQVTLSSYSIGETEVTQELWQAVMGSNPSHFSGTNLPVESVSWNDCQTFITKLNQMTGKQFRLPTEAQWEFAARGGIKSNGYVYSGSDTCWDVGWSSINSNNMSHPVGTKKPNELGIYDMSGNVLEWCQDWYDNYTAYAQTDPTGSTDGPYPYRVMRGGGWWWNYYYCTVIDRFQFLPGNSNNYSGFRLAM